MTLDTGRWISGDTRALIAMKRFNTLMQEEVSMKEEYGYTRESNIKRAIRDADDIIEALGYNIDARYRPLA